MSKVFLLTSVPPRGAKTGRQEKVNYRVNKLLDNNYEVTVIVPDLNFCNYNIRIDKGMVKYYGPDLSTYNNTHNEDSSYKNKVANNFSEFINNLPLSQYQPWYLIPTIKLLHSLCSNDDILITQSYPFVNNLVGYATKILFPEILWVMEYRDPWLTNPTHFPDGGSLIDKYLERECIKNCDSIVYFNGSQIPEDYFMENYKNQNNKVNKISSWGFNEPNIRDANSVTRSQFTIVHAGSFWEEGTEMKHFIKGLRQFIQSNKIKPGDFKLVFLGSRPDGVFSEKKSINMNEYVDWLGWQDHQTAIEHIKGADYGLYIQRVLEGDQMNISTKMFDYIGTSTPVICLSREGWQSWEFVNKYEIGIVASIDDPDDIQSSLETAFYSNNHFVAQEVRDKFQRCTNFDIWLSILNSDPV